jgi:hypothetical protein
MGDDSDPITLDTRVNDLSAIAWDVLSGIQYKLFMFMLLVFYIVSSDVFVGRVLGRFGGATKNKQATSYGVFLQGMLLVMMMVIVDAGIKSEIV